MGGGAVRAYDLTMTTWSGNHFPRNFSERKLKMRQAQAEAKKEIEEYRAHRETKLRSVQPEVRRRRCQARRSRRPSDDASRY